MARVLVTGVGGGVGQSIVKSLAPTVHEVVGADADVLAAGLYAVPIAYHVPRANDPSFVDHLLEICRADGCQVVFPGLDLELAVLAEAAPRFRQAGVHVVVSRPEVVALCDDKLATAEFLIAHGLPAPETVPLGDGLSAADLPVVLKPRWGGSRSTGVFVVRTARELSVALAQVDPANCVVQEFLDGDEFTCGTVTLGGAFRGCIVMRRTLRAGDTYRATVVRDSVLEDHVQAVVEALSPDGPCNVQLRLRGRQPVAFELNARCSGTTAARTLAGFNEPAMIVDHALQGIVTSPVLRVITVVRYWNEVVIDQGRRDALVGSRRSAGPGSPL